MSKLNNYIIDIENFTKLENNWDGYGAVPLLPEVFENSKSILEVLSEIPSDVYPNPHGTLGIEYENEETNNYLRIEVGKESMTYSTLFFSKDKVIINKDSLEDLRILLLHVTSEVMVPEFEVSREIDFVQPFSTTTKKFKIRKVKFKG
jgi:hypothetical protein